MRRDFDEARQHDGLLAKKTKVRQQSSKQGRNPNASHRLSPPLTVSPPLTATHGASPSASHSLCRPSSLPFPVSLSLSPSASHSLCRSSSLTPESRSLSTFASHSLRRPSSLHSRRRPLSASARLALSASRPSSGRPFTPASLHGTRSHLSPPSALTAQASLQHGSHLFAPSASHSLCSRTLVPASHTSSSTSPTSRCASRPLPTIDSLNPSVLIRFRRGLLSNYSSWCSYLDQKSKIWLPERNPRSADLRRELLSADLRRELLSAAPLPSLLTRTKRVPPKPSDGVSTSMEKYKSYIELKRLGSTLDYSRPQSPKKYGRDANLGEYQVKDGMMERNLKGINTSQGTDRWSPSAMLEFPSSRPWGGAIMHVIGALSELQPE
ncbi:hypothetical protein Syun_018828 [Stephania yunnanensis]|uniref:Uncharacterized protein n=1 Tax=Stephania yunnanensis TaxID=152371 RepID=A0AAP0NYS5_9MAGN